MSTKKGLNQLGTRIHFGGEQKRRNKTKNGNDTGMTLRGGRVGGENHLKGMMHE
jgi:hypothetical protein